ncbi:reverse transcriptase domain, reverse transcriptase zinc-binding domain protein [Tanacetum coccineum]|uniref:Reverse transcriptase domain, reverse transcriptase zinc-binding domain protein n=1 Tax=Tanacetum coccineum TaxID=301880 RepID=A0ABQ5BGH0_9ASTR
MHNYHLNRGPSGCAFKIDIQKAYDTVSWKFLKDILFGFGFHSRMIEWIMACVTSTSFSINVNGNLHGFLMGGVVSVKEIIYDLISFHGDVHSAKVIMDSLDEFKIVSGFVPSIPKSIVFFCNVRQQVKTSILHLMSFEEGYIPIINWECRSSRHVSYIKIVRFLWNGLRKE